jgi:hypothetical protein
MTPSVMLVGEQNPYGEDQKYALYPLPENSAGGRLCHRVLGMSTFQYIRSFRRVNLLGPGKWRATDVNTAAQRLIVSAPAGSSFILLGAKVTAAFGATDLADFESSVIPVGLKFLRLPHPSGRARQWNDPASFERARAALRAFLPPEIAALIGSRPPGVEGQRPGLDIT